MTLLFILLVGTYYFFNFFNTNKKLINSNKTTHCILIIKYQDNDKY